MRDVIAGEPLVLFDTDDLVAVFDQEAMAARRARGLSGRVAIDHRIAKVLPAGARCRIAPSEAGRGTVRVLGCDYAPFAGETELWAIEDLLVPAEEWRGAVFEAPSELPAWSGVRDRLRAGLGARYLWGGTSAAGSPGQERWLLDRGLVTEVALAGDDDLAIVAGGRGFDCSGLFCAATGFHYLGDCKDFAGVMPGALVVVSESEAAAVQRDPEAMRDLLRPGDVLLYRGHMLIVMDEDRVIQAVGEGENAEAFAAVTEHDPRERYDGVVEDEGAVIRQGLLKVQKRILGRNWAGYARGELLIVRPDYGREEEAGT